MEHKAMLAFSTGSLYNYGLRRTFELAREAGFDGLEVLVDLRWDTRQAGYLSTLRDEFGLPVVSVHNPFLRMKDWEQDPIRRVERTVALAEALGAHVVVIHLPLRFTRLSVKSLFVRATVQLPWLWDGRYARWIVDELPAYQATTPVTIAVECMPHHRTLGLRVNPFRLNDLEGLARLSCLTLDTTHLGTWGVDVLAAYERLADRVAHVHLSNYDGREHRLPHKGRLPLAQFLACLKADGYGGIVTLEVHPEALGAGDEGRVRQNLRAAVDFCRRHRVG